MSDHEGPVCAWCGGPVQREDVDTATGVAVCRGCMARELGKAQAHQHSWAEYPNGEERCRVCGLSRHEDTAGAVSPDVPPFRWGQKAKEAAVLCAEDHHSDEEIGRRLHLARRTLTRWRRHPEFRAAVERERQAIIARLRHTTLREKEARLTQLEHMNGLQWDIVAARAEDPEHSQAAGGKTGFVIRSVTTISTGKGRGRTLIEEKADVPLMAEIRGGLQQIAKEMGQWSDKAELTGAGGGPMRHEHAGPGGGPIIVEDSIPDAVLRWIVSLAESPVEGPPDAGVVCSDLAPNEDPGAPS